MELFAGQRVARRSRALVELNVDFTAREDRIFTFSRPNAIPTLFWSPDKAAFKDEILRSARQLVSLCITLQDDPVIRYDASSKVAKILAKTFNMQLEMTKESAGWVGQTKGVVLVVDRAVDVIAPLMHEFTYQALVGDQCAIQGEFCYLDAERFSSFTPAEKEQKTLILNEKDDPLWGEFRHQHIGTVMAAVPAQLRKFKKENKLAQFEEARKNDKDISIKDMAAALKDFTKYTSMATRFSQHTSLAAECMKKVDSRLLKDVATLEQDFVTGVNEDGTSVNGKKAKAALITLCQNPKLTAEDRFRLILVYMLSQGGVQAATRRELLRGIPDLCLTALHGVERLGFPVADEAFKPLAYDAERRNEGIARVANIILLRFVPRLWKLAQDLSVGSLSTKDFPKVSEKEHDEFGAVSSAPKGRRRKNNAPSAATDATVAPHLIIFVAGGLTYSEARECYALAEKLKLNVVFGGSDLISPSDFLASLADVPRGKWDLAVGNTSSIPPSFSTVAGTRPAAAPAAAAAAEAAEGSSKGGKSSGSKASSSSKPKSNKDSRKQRPDDDDSDLDIEAPDF